MKIPLRSLSVSLVSMVLWCSMVAQEPAFPLKASKNKRFLVDQNKVPFFLAGDAAWRIGYKISYADAERYLADRKRKGFNTVFMELTPDMPGNGDQPDINGEHLFVNRDIGQPNEKYLRHFDSVLQASLTMGFAVILFPMYDGCCNDGWIQILREPQNSDTNKLKAYGEWLADRYTKFPNIIWASGGDLEVTPESEMIARAIAAKDSIHLHTYHTNPVQTSSGALPNAAWLNLSMVYTYYPELEGAVYKMEHVYAQLYKEGKRNAHMPYLMAESCYEGERDETTQTLRRQAYWSITGGACGHIFGNKYGWQLIDGWNESLQSKGNAAMKIFNEFATSIEWYNLIPDWAHSVVVEGRGFFNNSDGPGGEEYMTVALSEDRRKLVAYMPTYRRITINMNRLAGDSFRIRWFDPSSGKSIRLPEIKRGGGVKNLVPPSINNSDCFQDWVLIVEAAPQPREGYSFLFNNKDLSGWKKEGPAKWEVENDEIVGESTGKAGYLVTVKSYKDFTLLVQFKIEKKGDGAVLFHKPSLPGGKGWAAVINSSGAGTGGVLELRTNKLLAAPILLPEQYLKKGSWNDFHIRLIEGELWTWINGQELIHVKNQITGGTKGPISLQVSAGNNIIRWRDIQISEERP